MWGVTRIVSHFQKIKKHRCFFLHIVHEEFNLLHAASFKQYLYLNSLLNMIPLQFSYVTILSYSVHEALTVNEIKKGSKHTVYVCKKNKKSVWSLSHAGHCT